MVFHASEKPGPEHARWCGRGRRGSAKRDGELAGEHEHGAALARRLVQLLFLGRPRVLVDAVILPERPERDKLLVAVLEQLGGRRGIGTHVGLELVADLERRGLRWVWGQGGAREISKASFQSHKNTCERNLEGMLMFGTAWR